MNENTNFIIEFNLMVSEEILILEKENLLYIYNKMINIIENDIETLYYYIKHQIIEFKIDCIIGDSKIEIFIFDKNICSSILE